LSAASEPDIVRRLVARGADVNAVDDDGETPLMLAAEHGDSDLVSALLDNRADLNRKDHTGKTARDHAKSADQGKDIKQAVIEALDRKTAPR
jgi:uncharacterized protein